MIIEDKYLGATNCKEGDTITFVDAGVKGEIEQKDKTKKKVYNFAVDNGEYVLTYTPSNKALKSFVEQWGNKTELWIGKSFQVKIVDIEVAGNEMKVVRPVFIDIKA